MYKYFGICVCLVLGVGRALCDAYFYCPDCQGCVNWKKWGSHIQQKHEGGYVEPKLLWCPDHKCCLSHLEPKPFYVYDASLPGNFKCKTVTPVYANKHMFSEHQDGPIAYDLWCTECEGVIPRLFWEMHLVRTHQVLKLYNAMCSDCHKQKHLVSSDCDEFETNNEFESPEEIEHPSKDIVSSNTSTITIVENLTLEAYPDTMVTNGHHLDSGRDDFFSKYITYECKDCTLGKTSLFCTECETGGIPHYLGIDHLFEKHSDKIKEYIPQYLFYCRECKKTFETPADFGGHMYQCQGCLGRETKACVFFCPLCRTYPEFHYEEHVVKSHKSSCIYCLGKPLPKNLTREEHMKKQHKAFCPFCKLSEFGVPLMVHIWRDHHICEGSCLYDMRITWVCGICKKNMVGSFYGVSNLQQESVPQKGIVKTHFKDSHYLLKPISKNLQFEPIDPCQRLWFRASGYSQLKGHGKHSGWYLYICPWCKTPLVPQFEGERLDLDECIEQHRLQFHKVLGYCRIKHCDYIYNKKADRDAHRLRAHKDVYIKCPEFSCKKAVKKLLLPVHTQKEHRNPAAFCAKCKRIGTGSCPNCGEWVYEACKKCPQRICGTCPQCGKKSFESCTECRQYVTGKCRECGSEVNGKCLKCVVPVTGRCPVCKNIAEGWCLHCKQRVSGECSGCGKRCDGVCLVCKQRVGKNPEINEVLQSHMTVKHEKNLNLNKQEVSNHKADKDSWRCEKCMDVLTEDKDLTAHCRDNHKGSPHGWCELCKRDFIDCTYGNHLRISHKAKRCGGCGEYVLGDGSDKRHLMRHTFYCALCDLDVPYEHMAAVHNCTPKCKPMADDKNPIWDIKHDESCPNRHVFKCNFPSCNFIGSGDDVFGTHIMEAHGCTKDCKYRRNGSQFEIEHCGCMSDETIQVNCSFDPCGFVGTRTRVLEHAIDKHGCLRGKCTYTNSRFEHSADCENKIFICSFDGCAFSGTPKEMEEHMCTHGCIPSYCTFKKGIPYHVVICPNRVFTCPLCQASPVTKQHLADAHKCHSFCHDSGEGRIDHHYQCGNKGKF